MRHLKRWIYLFLGFACYGLAIAMMVRAELGLGPWDAFHQGVAKQTGLKIGTAAMIVGAAVMLFWLPLRQKPGIGTVLNVLCIGPMQSTFKTVPMPGFCRSGSQNSMTAAPTIIAAVPIFNPVCLATPW